jgi:nucleoside-diphosphate-sugar epimerase
METRRVLLTGGCGYVGSALVPTLLERGHTVTVLDAMMVEGVPLPSSPRLEVVRGDIRDSTLLERLLGGQDAVIHLAFVSNDPEYALDPALGEAINGVAFRSLVALSQRQGVRRFIFPSSCSVYGQAKEAAELSEEAPTAPLTAYARFKLECEQHLRALDSKDFQTVCIRAATVCGYSARLRLDLLVNRMVAEAHHRREIVIQRPDSIRPCIHIQDLAELYAGLLERPLDGISGQVFNAAFENRTALETGRVVQELMGGDVTLKPGESSRDARSYRVSSRKLAQQWGFTPRRTLEDTVRELRRAFEEGWLSEPWTADRYYNKQAQRRLALVP